MFIDLEKVYGSVTINKLYEVLCASDRNEIYIRALQSI